MGFTLFLAGMETSLGKADKQVRLKPKAGKSRNWSVSFSGAQGTRNMELPRI